MVKGKNIYVTFDMIKVLEDIKFKERFKKPSDSIRFLYDHYLTYNQNIRKMGKTENGKHKTNGKGL